VEAADEGNVEALRLLLDHGLNIEDQDMSWYPFNEDEDEPYESQGTALYRAYRQGNVECVELLLERGADPLAKDLEGTSCLDIARQRGHDDVV
jgi:ankyrin repeat protein